MHAKMNRAPKFAAVALGTAGLATAAHVATYGLWRRWCLDWGTIGSEPGAALPGDDLLPDPVVITTRAIGINAPVGSVWPWLVQMGPGRAGAYTYDWIENLLGLNMHSANVIVPRLQHIAVGDGWQLGQRGAFLRVARVDPERALVLRSDDGAWVWAFVLEPGAGASRLISRNRIAIPGDQWLSRMLYRYLMEPGSLVMERKMLIGTKERAERPAIETTPYAQRDRWLAHTR